MEGVNFISSQCWIQPPLPLTLVPNLATQLSATLVLGEERKFILIQTILFWNFFLRLLAVFVPGPNAKSGTFWIYYRNKGEKFNQSASFM